MRSWPVICLPGGKPRGRTRSGRRSFPGGASPQTAERSLVQPADGSGPHAARQLDRPVADPQQAADFEADGLPEPAHLAISALVQHHAEAAVGALARSLGPDAIEARRPVLEDHSLEERANRLGPRPAANPHQVLPLDLAG